MSSYDRAVFKIIFFILSLLLTSCGHNRIAPVVDLTPVNNKISKYHIVKSGETLLDIAVRYNKKVHNLAVINNIHYPYRIYPKQKILLFAQDKQLNKKKIINQYVNQNITWHWPILQGPVGAKVNNIHGKGIDIFSKLGEPVYAAASGKIVYLGSGLRGYGNLIIIKHTENLLSAYAFNNKLFVQEGQIVKIGQKIAEVGLGKDGKEKLHFQIRNKGQVVNPLEYLPKTRA